MRQTSILPFLAPAFVSYLVAAVASQVGRLDALDWVIAALAVGASAAPARVLLAERVRGRRRSGLLALCAGVALVGWVAPELRSLPREMLCTGAWVGFAALLVDLALDAPDRPWPASAERKLRASIWIAAAASVSLAMWVLAPVFTFFGELWLLSPRWLVMSQLYVGMAPIAALVARLLRRRLGSSPEALASSTWGVVGLLPMALLAPALWLLPGVQDAWVRGLIAPSAMAAVAGHALMLDPTQGLRAGRATRDVVALGLTFVALTAAFVGLRHRLPDDPVLSSMFVVLALALGVPIHRVARPLVRTLLAPASGRLLDAIDAATERLTRVQSLDDVARAVLGPLRHASSSPEAEPRLYVLAPAREALIDLAGEPRVAPGSMPRRQLLQRLMACPGEIVIRRPLEQVLVRQPSVRPIVDALTELDALCVVPLSREGELEGALVIPQGRRRAALTLEEIEALVRFAKYLTAFVAVLAAAERSTLRENQLRLEMARSGDELARQRERNAHMRAEIDVQRTFPEADVIAYSAAMKAFRAAADRAAAHAPALLLVSETGGGLEAIARGLHQRSARGGGPFIVRDCAAYPTEDLPALLLGDASAAPPRPGWLRLCATGTLALIDVPALPPGLQAALGEALARGQACSVDGSAFTLDVRVIATARRGLDALGADGGLHPALVEVLESSALTVPSLRERGEDLPSLTLLAIDRACRVLGRDPVGISSEAQGLLSRHSWPGDLAELHAVLHSAVSRCAGSRIGPADLPGLFAPRGEGETRDPLVGRYEHIERRVLLRALEGAGGNKSEAARSLGLKRTTFLDKLRRHGLEETPQTSAPSPPS